MTLQTCVSQISDSIDNNLSREKLEDLKSKGRGKKMFFGDPICAKGQSSLPVQKQKTKFTGQQKEKSEKQLTQNWRNTVWAIS
jgi:hypothetical protein